MLKGFVSGVEKDIKRIPMLVGNEYKEGWEVRDNQDRLIWGREDEFQTTTGTLPFKGYGLPVKVKSLLGNGIQNGTPTPDAPIMPTFCGVRTANLFDPNGVTTNESGVTRAGVELPAGAYCITNLSNAACYWRIGVETTTGSQINPSAPQVYINAPDTLVVWVGANSNKNIMLNLGSTALPYEPYGYKIPLTNAGQTLPVYLGEVPTVRRVRKLVLTGKEKWKYESAYTRFYMVFQNSLIIGVRATPAFCTHFQVISDSRPIENVPNYSVYSNSVNMQWFFKDTEYTTIDAWKSYLAAQYAAGTPVTVWYVLAEPKTAIVNEPLCKIGDYADELNDTVATLPEIPTTTGQNTLTIDTTLAPSSLTIKGHIKEWQPENLLPVSKFEDLSDPSWWSGGYYIRYNSMPAGTYVMSTNMPEKDPGDVYFNGENRLNVPYEGRPVSITINEGDSFYVLFFVDRGGYESILNGTYTITLIKSE